MRAIQLESVGSPIGDLLVATLGDAVCAIAFEGSEADTERYLARRYGECRDSPWPCAVAGAHRPEALFRRRHGGV